jgi:hypothetical protein
MTMFRKFSAHFLMIVLCAMLTSVSVFADNTPPEASVNGKYVNLLQVMNCPKDGAKYGNFKDYGYWGGGPWCNQTGKPGFWVWVAPNWYVWANKTSSPPSLTSDTAPSEASVNGKYVNLIQVMNCPKDGASYGNFRDYGYWGGGAWCNQTGRAGFWVWVAPNWYVWQNKNE